MASTTRITLTLLEEVVDLIDRMADEEGSNRGVVVNRIVKAAAGHVSTVDQKPLAPAQTKTKSTRGPGRLPGHDKVMSKIMWPHRKPLPADYDNFVYMTQARFHFNHPDTGEETPPMWDTIIENPGGDPYAPTGPNGLARTKRLAWICLQNDLDWPMGIAPDPITGQYPVETGLYDMRGYLLEDLERVGEEPIMCLEDLLGPDLDKPE